MKIKGREGQGREGRERERERDASADGSNARVSAVGSTRPGVVWEGM